VVLEWLSEELLNMAIDPLQPALDALEVERPLAGVGEEGVLENVHGLAGGQRRLRSQATAAGYGVRVRSGIAEIVDPIVLAYSFAHPGRAEDVRPRLERVAAHYQDVAHESLEQREWLGESCGMAAFHDPGLHGSWPWWVESGDLVMVSPYVPIGWERLVGDLDPLQAAPRLADEIWRQPQAVSERLNVPSVVAIADTRVGVVRLQNDALGAGRLYEQRFPGGRAWSNRLAALSLFSGVSPSVSERGWALFAASGWFMRDSTPIDGITKVAPASVIRIDRGGVEERTTGALGALLVASDALESRVDGFAEQAQDTVRAAAAMYPAAPRIDLSGGRDSRVSAAAAVAAAIEARFHTSDVNPGEAAVAEQLVAASPRRMDHQVQYGGEQMKQHTTDLRERALRMFRIHDGMRHAGNVRGRLQIPPRAHTLATVSGHGGEIGHGFYYANEKQLRRIERGGSDGLVDRLEQASRRAHDAGTEAIYEQARREFAAAIDEGREIGLEGPTLLDYYYLTDRFAHRSGLAASTHRVTVFATPAFLSAAFSLRPEERLEAGIHREAIRRLVPEWSSIPFYQPERSRLPSIKRERIWEGDDGEAMAEMLAEEGVWSDLFDVKRVKKLWKRARRGKGHKHYEQVFERIACRVAFEDYRALITTRINAPAGRGSEEAGLTSAASATRSTT
jgi:hypothetical protein